MEWWSFSFGLVGVLLAVVGFVMGWRQIKKVRDAANAARDAALRATERVADRIAIEELGELRLNLRSLMQSLVDKKRETAYVYCELVRRSVSGLPHREGLSMLAGEADFLVGHARLLGDLQSALHGLLGRAETPWPVKTMREAYDHVIVLDNKMTELTNRVRTDQTTGRPT